MRLRTNIALSVAGVVLVTTVLGVAGIFRPLADQSNGILLPVARLFSSFGSAAGKGLASQPSAKELMDKNTELEARLSSITVDYVHLKSLEEENRALHALTKFLTDSGYDHVGARVIARSTDPQSATVLIDRGASDGLEVGMAAVVGDGIFIGKVTELRDRVATITLVSDGRSRVAASTAGAHRLIGLVEGRGNNVARLTLVPQVEVLKRNDVIVTSGTEDKVPPNLVIGLINEIEGKPTDPFQNASLEPLAKTDQLDLVAILRPVALRPNAGKGTTP